MADIADASTLSPLVELSSTPTRVMTTPNLWSRLALGAIVLVSIFMNFFQLGQNGYGNLYLCRWCQEYARIAGIISFLYRLIQAVLSLLISHRLASGCRALSSKIFGFTPFSIFFPQALCGVLAVILLYMLVRRHFGVVAGLVRPRWRLAVSRLAW